MEKPYTYGLIAWWEKVIWSFCKEKKTDVIVINEFGARMTILAEITKVERSAIPGLCIIGGCFELEHSGEQVSFGGNFKTNKEDSGFVRFYAHENFSLSQLLQKVEDVDYAELIPA